MISSLMAIRYSARMRPKETCQTATGLKEAGSYFFFRGSGIAIRGENQLASKEFDVFRIPKSRECKLNCVKAFLINKAYHSE